MADSSSVNVTYVYLFSPTFQFMNISGKPLVDGYIEVYISGTRSKYYAYSDFDGTLHPFKIQLNALGSAVVLVSPAHSYDVYVYNSLGVLQMSRYNIIPATVAQPIEGDYITPAELETALEPYATSAWVEENFSKQAVRVSYDAQTEELHLDFSPAPTDYVLIGDRLYHYVQIGDQLWIDENLDYKFAYDGGTLPIGASGTPSTPAAWYYGNDEATYGVDGNKYGLLYNWYAAKYLEDNKSTLLPEGWHVPSTTDWDTLETAVGGASTAVTVLKSTTGWTDGAGTNDYGFNGVPAGDYYGSFRYLGSRAYFWTSVEKNGVNAYYRLLGTSFISPGFYKFYGCSVRLVKSLT